MLDSESTRQWLHRSRSDDELQIAVQNRLTRLLPMALCASLVVSLGTAALAWGHRHDHHVSWWMYEASAFVTLAAITLRRAGRPRQAGIVLSAGFFLLTAAGVLLLGGPHSPACFLLVPVVLTAALFWSARASAVMAAMNVLLVAGGASLRTAGYLPTPLVMPPSALAGIVGGSIAISTVLAGVALRSLQDAVAEAHRRGRELTTLFRECPDAVVVLDDTGIVRNINPRALAILGLYERDVVGRHFAALPIFSKDDAAVAIRRFWSVLTGARRTFALRIARDDATVFWGDARAHTFIRDGMRCIQIIIRDVTHRKLAEERRAELQVQLLKLQRFEIIGRLSGAVAHDVNNLLSVVALSASTLRSQLGPEAQEVVDALSDSASRAAKLNRRLLHLGRQDVIVRERLDVNAMIEEMRRLLERLVDFPRELVLRLGDEPCMVLADPGQLEQIVINLVTNGRDAIVGPGRLTIETERSVEMVHLRVSDTGVGMDAATRERIFEPFFTTKGIAGTGLGLAAVRDIVSSYGGRIEVESHPGFGTRFDVLLPALPA